MRFPTLPLLLAALLSLPLVAPAARADEPAAADAPARALAERRAWAARVRELRAQQRDALAAPTAALRELPPGEARAAAQRALEDAKREWRRRMLEAQLERARAAGQSQHAARLQDRIGEMDALARPHPAPRAGGGAR